MGGQWVRVKVNADTPLRRGAWYRVTSVTSLGVVVAMDGKTISVPRSLVEFRDTPPREWTVVGRETAPPKSHVILRNGYIVCPDCGARLVLPPAEVREQLCPRCRGIFSIAWEETYLTSPDASSAR